MGESKKPHLGIKYIPHFIFICFLGIIYIANTYTAEKTINQINEIQNDIEAIRIQYNSLKYRYTQRINYDSIKKEVAPLGLIENDSQMILIEVVK